MTFNQDPTAPYGHAVDGGTTFQTEKDAQEYMSAHPGKSVHVTNPPRDRRVMSKIHMEVAVALEDVWETFADYVDDGELTMNEIATALWSFDLESEWLEAAEELEIYEAKI